MGVVAHILCLEWRDLHTIIRKYSTDTGCQDGFSNIGASAENSERWCSLFSHCHPRPNDKKLGKRRVRVDYGLLSPSFFIIAHCRLSGRLQERASIDIFLQDSTAVTT